MNEAVLQYAVTPEVPLLTKYPDLPGLRKIERLIKPASFTMAQKATPSPAPASKRQRVNLNVSPQQYDQNNQRPGSASGRGRGGRFSQYRGRGGGRSEFRGRGNYHMAHWTPEPASITTPRTAPTAGSVHTPRPQIIGRILSFEDDL